jgi:hypothetical protein
MEKAWGSVEGYQCPTFPAIWVCDRNFSKLRLNQIPKERRAVSGTTVGPVGRR